MTAQATPVENLKQSRVGKRAVDLPKGVTATIKDGKIEIKGPKGTAVRALTPNVVVKIEGAAIELVFWIEAHIVAGAWTAGAGKSFPVINNRTVWAVSAKISKLTMMNTTGASVTSTGAPCIAIRTTTPDSAPATLAMGASIARLMRSRLRFSRHCRCPGRRCGGSSRSLACRRWSWAPLPPAPLSGSRCVRRQRA